MIPARTAVLGLGNVLRRDDGVGPAVVAWLDARYAFPPNLDVLDLGTPGLDLADHLVERASVVFVDAIVDGRAAGSVHVLDPAALRGPTPALPRSPRLTSHEAGVEDALFMAALDGRGPRHVRLVGIVVADLGDGPGLSPAVEAAIPAAGAAVLAELEALGLTATPRAEIAEDAAWWRRFTPAR